jgi:dTMP kinase
MFITFEGPDGSGKSTQMCLLVDFLRQQGLKVFPTREPGGTSIGDQVRDILMRLDNRSMHPRTEALLFCSARAQLVEEIIRPRLEMGEIVICDRYADSTLAYQGYGHQRDIAALRHLLNYATGGLWPDLTILLDINAEKGLLRRKTGGGEWNRMDDYRLALHERVRQGYLQMAQIEPQRWLAINADQTPESVQEEIQHAVLPRIRAFIDKEKYA